MALWVPTAVHVLQQAATGFREPHLDGLSALLALEAGVQLDAKQTVHHRGVRLRWVLHIHTKRQFRGSFSSTKFDGSRSMTSLQHYEIPAGCQGIASESNMVWDVGVPQNDSFARRVTDSGGAPSPLTAASTSAASSTPLRPAAKSGPARTSADMSSGRLPKLLGAPSGPRCTASLHAGRSAWIESCAAYVPRMDSRGCNTAAA